MSSPSSAAPSQRPKRSYLPWIVGLAVLAGGGTWYAYRGGAPTEGSSTATAGPRGGGPRGERPVPVTVATIVTGDIRVTVPALGSVVPRNLVTVRSRVDGPLLAVKFVEGQPVKAGEVLALIDPEPFRAALEQARGQLARDQALLKNARIDLERYRGLLAQDSIAKQQVDTQEALVRQYQGTVQTDEGNLRSAELQLSYTTIKAPISGRVGLRAVDPGNIVKASDAAGLVTIAQVSPITAVFPVPEERLPAIMKRLREGRGLKVEAWDREMRTRLAEGSLLAVDAQIDSTTGTVKLKADFANKDGSLFPNQFVNVRLLLDTLSRRGHRAHGGGAAGQQGGVRLPSGGRRQGGRRAGAPGPRRRRQGGGGGGPGSGRPGGGGRARQA
jgi:multidrug efflux system membrane fusion protein